MATRRIQNAAPLRMRWPSDDELAHALRGDHLKAGARRGGALLPPGQPPGFTGVSSYYEDIGSGSEESSKAKFTVDGATSSRVWDIQPTSVGNLQYAVQTALGTTNYAASNDGKLTRKLPLPDPVFPWMFADHVTELQGYGRYKQFNNNVPNPEDGKITFPNGTLWQFYHMHLESMQRPYPVLPDSSILTGSGTWFSESAPGKPATPTSAMKHPLNFCYEQMRFCIWNMQPQNDYITQQKGQLTAWAKDLPGDHSTPFTGMPATYLPNQIYTVTWMYVPIRLIISPKSFIRSFRGRVNQNSVFSPEGQKFDPGSLLYLGFSFKMFTPPVPTLVPIGGRGQKWGNGYAKFAHITMNFLFTERFLEEPLYPPSTPTNKNYVWQGGHNLLPGADGRFRYYTYSNSQGLGTSRTKSEQNRPLFLSAPLEILWTDCDGTNVIF